MVKGAKLRITSPSPAFFALVAANIRLSRSSSSSMRWETPTKSVAGRYISVLPTKDMRVVTLAPFLPQGVFIICTISSSPGSSEATPPSVPRGRSSAER